MVLVLLQSQKGETLNQVEDFMKKSLIILTSILSLTMLLGSCDKKITHYDKIDKDQPTQLNKQTVYLNKTILETLDTYDRDGSYPYSWKNSYKGVSQDLYYQNCLIANAKKDSSYSTFCCGITFEVYFKSIMKVLGEGKDLNGMTAKDFEDFIAKWFVLEVNGDGPGLALEAYGLGKSIDHMKDVIAGDFVQIWRNNGSGHSVIFIDWLINENADTTGMKYWSTQPSTKGINFNKEYFDSYGGKVDKSVTHYSRAFCPKNFLLRK